MALTFRKLGRSSRLATAIAASLISGAALAQDPKPPTVKAPAAKVPGTIHTAVSLSFDRWFKPGTSIFVSTEQARKIAARDLAKPADETISFCNTGHWAAIDWFALSEVVGQKNVKLYPASLVEWTQSPEALPMDNVPGRGSQILNDLKNLIGKVS